MRKKKAHLKHKSEPYLLRYPSICISVEGSNHVAKGGGSLVQANLHISTAVPQAVAISVLTRV